MNTMVVDFDDFCDGNNGLDILFHWKARFPQLKVTLFTIPDKTSLGMLRLLGKLGEWIQLGVHGYSHSSNFEVQYWDKEMANKYLDLVEVTGFYQKVFRAPGWQLTYPQPYNEQPDLSKPVNSNPQLIYNILKEKGYLVADQHYNQDKRPAGLKVYCSCNPMMVHGHIQNIETGEPNGLKQIDQAGVPWNDQTVFKFISELSDEELRCR